MPRLRKRDLPHRVDYTPFARDSAEGDVRGEPVLDRPAYVEHKMHLVIDQRLGSDTFGQQVAAQTFVVMLPEDDVLPRDMVTVEKGTPRQRTAEVIRSWQADYPRTPKHLELWLE